MDIKLLLLAICPKVSSFLSMVGSFALLAECLYYDRKRLERVMYRILCLVAVFGILESIWNFASTWAIPKIPDNQAVFESGTDFTCNVQGFFLQLAVAIPILNTALTFYYLFVIRFSWSEEQIMKKAEGWFYTVAFIWGIGTSVASLSLGLYEPSNSSWCWIGNEWNVYRLLFYFIPLFACFFITALNMSLVCWTVHSLEAASNRYRKSAYEKKAAEKAAASRQKFQKSVRKVNNVLRVSKLAKLENATTSGNHTISTNGSVSVEQLSGIRKTHSERISALLKKQKSVQARRAAQNSLHAQAIDTNRVLALRAKSKADTTKYLAPSNITASSSTGLEKAAEMEKEEMTSNTFALATKYDKNWKSSVKSGNGLNESKTEPLEVFDTPEKKRSILNFKKRNSDLSLRSEPSTESRATRSKTKKSKSRQVTEQAFFYVFSFLLTFTWSIVIRFLQWNNIEIHFLLKLGNAFFDPLQGFINYLVFIRPRYIGFRGRFPEKTRMQILCSIVTHQELSVDEDKEIEDEARKELKEWRERQSEENHDAAGVPPAQECISDSMNDVEGNIPTLRTANIRTLRASSRRLSSMKSVNFEEEKMEIEP